MTLARWHDVGIKHNVGMLTSGPAPVVDVGTLAWVLFLSTMPTCQGPEAGL